MNTLVRSTSLALCHGAGYYEVLSRSGKTWGEDGLSRRAGSKRKKDQEHLTMSLSYRRDRAKKRQIFLRTYRLSSLEKEKPLRPTSRKLKKLIVKVKSVVKSVFAFARICSLRSCSGGQAFRASCPTLDRRVP
uniref:Uncharacterized protein n=1 Tax=Nelumbo nucifera TaxID=4432 RepID=A0A822XSI4_NELNU|nr:TPA_asm: hypothetical protein HUJ06_024435 [Nelumbo nucifera]